jgi:hypothetical protein
MGLRRRTNSEFNQETRATKNSPICEGLGEGARKAAIADSQLLTGEN